MSHLAKKRIAVIGAGTVGLSVALRLSEEFKKHLDITIIAAEFLQQTTSYGSGGLWEPYQIAGTPDSLINTWGKYSFDHFKDLYHSPDCVKAGVQLLSAYHLIESGQDAPEHSWKDIVFNFTELNQADLKKMGLPDRFVGGCKFGTFVVDQKYYMKYLTGRLESFGVHFEQRRLSSMKEFLDDPRSNYDCIVNCTGLGAATVNSDESMYPIRGQVLRVKAPWMKSCWFFGTPTSYIIPNIDNVVLGGTANRGNWDTTVSLDDTRRIVDNIADVFPSIRDAPIEYAWAGLRPGRTPLRLETQMMSTATKSTDSNNCSAGNSTTGNWGISENNTIPVVHCYGHGGSGITIAMGCANEVVTKHVQLLLNLPIKDTTTSTNSSACVKSTPIRPAYVEFSPKSRL